MTDVKVTIDPTLRGRPLALAVAEFIRKRPLNFDMGNWASVEGFSYEAPAGMMQVELGDDGYCGTTFCVAGAARYLSGGEVFLSKPRDIYMYPNTVDEKGRSIDWTTDGAQRLELDRGLADRVFNKTDADPDDIIEFLERYGRGGDPHEAAAETLDIWMHDSEDDDDD